MNLEFTNIVPLNDGVYAVKVQRHGKVHLFFADIKHIHNILEWTIYNMGDATIKHVNSLSGAEFALVPPEMLIPVAEAVKEVQ